MASFTDYFKNNEQGQMDALWLVEGSSLSVSVATFCAHRNVLSPNTCARPLTAEGCVHEDSDYETSFF